MLAIIFTLLLPSPASAHEFSRYVKLFYLAESRLERFDAELADNNGRPDFLARSTSYSELLGLRLLREAEGRALVKKFANNTEGDNPTSTVAIALQLLDPGERLAVQELLPKFKGPVPVFYGSLGQELEARRAAVAYRKAQIEAASSDLVLSAEVAKARVRLPLSESKVLKIRPGTGPEGTVNGSQFPLRTWALTFDDGPSSIRTPQVLDNLTKHGKRVTFFWVIEELEKNIGMPAKAIALAHSVNNHSWSHPNIAKVPADAQKKEVTESTARDTELYGERPRFFRLPFGAGLTAPPVRQLLAENNLIHVLWNVDTLDWQDKDPASVLARVKKGMAAEKKGIILFHDIHAQSVEASRLLLAWSDSLDGSPESLRWVTLPDIVRELNGGEVLSYLKKLPAKARTKRVSRKNSAGIKVRPALN